MPDDVALIANRFEIESFIAQGGMARVYRGTDRTLARTVAIKVLLEHLGRDETFVARFRREAQAAASLAHPNIVAVYDTGSERGLHYIVMEYLEGRTLHEVLAGDGPLAPQVAAALGAQIGEALAHAHEKGIVHRDVKPGNIMVSGGGQAKVMDFGIAKAATAGALTQVGAILGTVTYLSPEQARGETLDGRSDIYSLGALVYQMLTGEPPIKGETIVDMVLKLNSQMPPPPSHLNAEVPAALDAVVMRALAKDPDRRFQSGSEMAERLLLAVKPDPSPTAAYIPDPEPESARTMVAPRTGPVSDERTAVIGPAPGRARAAGGFGSQSVWIGLAALVALLAVAFVLFRGLGDRSLPKTPQVAPTPTVSVSPSRTAPVLIHTPRPRPSPSAPPRTSPAPEPAPSSEPAPQPPPVEPSPPVPEPSVSPGESPLAQFPFDGQPG